MVEAPGCSRLEFRVLGPLEVTRDGLPLQLGGTRQRALLAALLVNANHVVPTERLIEELFETPRSDSAGNRLRVGISRLRDVLGEGRNGDSEAVLHTRRGGYVLLVEPDQIDFLLFERLSEEGRQALLRGDAATASVTLRRALAIWRGEPFADIAWAEVVQGEIRRLDGLRTAAAMDYMDAELALGSDVELVSRLESLVAAHPSQERLVGQLILALYRSGRQADALEVCRTQRGILREDLGLEPGPELAELERAILRHDPDLDRPPVVSHGPVVSRVMVCPYKGLASFDARDAEYFCGREPLVASLTTRLTGGGLVGIVGASGVGKSSILRAGLIPALAAGALPGSDSWEYVVVRPGSHPSAALTDAVRDRDCSRRLLVAVDQFEETFTACRDPVERDRFLAELVRLALESDVGGVVIALRADYYGRCGDWVEFARLLSNNHALVGRMSSQQMLDAVEFPAAKVGLALEPGLAETVVEDIGDQPGGLPLLQTALLELWAVRRGSELTLEHYRALGGVRGAVARLAERAYAQLDEAEKAEARAVMMRLVAGDGPSAVRRRAPLSELDLDRKPKRKTALDTLTGWRLVTVSDNAVEVAHEALLTEWPRLEGWMDDDREGRRLHVHLATAAVEWDRGGRDPAELYRGARLAAALDWSAAHAVQMNLIETDFLARSGEESQREMLAQRRRNRRLRGLLAGAVALLVFAATAGVIAAVQRSHADSAAAAANQSATTALAQTLGAEAVSETQIDRALLLAVEGTKLAASPITRSDLLATLDRSPHITATYYLGQGIRPNAVAVSPDGKLLSLSAYNSPKLFTYSTSTRKLIRTQQPPTIDDIAYTPDSRTMAVLTNGDSSSSTKLMLYDAQTGRLRRSLGVPATRGWTLHAATGTSAATPIVRCLAFTGRGRFAWTVVTNGRTAWLVRWNLTTGAARSARFSGVPYSMTVPTDGRTVVVDNGPHALVFSQDSLRMIGRVPLPSGHRVLALSTGGDRVAISQAHGITELMNLRTNATTPLTNASTARLNAAAFTPNGRKLVADNAVTGTVVVWDTATGHLLQTDPGHSVNAQAISISGNGRYAYVGSLDGSVIAFDLSGTHSFGTPFSATSVQPGGEVQPLAVSENGSTIALPTAGHSVQLLTGSGWRQRSFISGYPGDSTYDLSLSGKGVLAVLPTTYLPGAMLWNLAGRSPRRIGLLPGVPADQKSALYSLVFTPDGRRAVGVGLYGPRGQHNNLVVYDVNTRNVVRQRTIPSPADVKQDVTVSPDGRRVALALSNGDIHVYSLPGLRLLGSRRVTPGVAVEAVEYSPNGRTVASGDGNGLVDLFDSHTLKPVHTPLPVHSAGVLDVSFSNDGSLLAASGADGTTRLINVGAWRAIGGPLPGSEDAWTDAVFTSDDRLVNFSADGTGTVLPLSQAALTSAACRVAHRDLTQAEWQEFLPGRVRQPVCS